MRQRTTLYTFLTCFGLVFTFETFLESMFMKKRRNNKKWRYPTFPSNSQGCFGHPNAWYPCRCFQSVLHLKSKWDFSFFFNLAVNLTGTEWSRKEVDMMSFMVKLHANYVGNSGFSLPLPSGLGSTGLIFCDPLDRSPPGSSVPGISQARTLEWFAISFCRGSFWPKDRTCGSCINELFSIFQWSQGMIHDHR